MAPLPPESTRRWFLNYTTCGFQHTLEMRSADTVDETQASTALDAFLSALSSLLRAVTINSLATAAQGSTITVPAAWGGASSYGSGGGSRFETANMIDFVGRTIEGRRSRAGVFGCVVASDNGDYRAQATEETAIADALTALLADAECFLAIDGNVPFWNQYANLGPNAYWRNKVRD